MLFSTGAESAAKVWDVNVVQTAIRVKTSVRTSSDHVWLYSGSYDTTSNPFSVGKGLPMQKLKESPQFRNHAKVLTKKSNSQEEKIRKKQQHRGRGKRLLFCCMAELLYG